MQGKYTMNVLLKCLTDDVYQQLTKLKKTTYTMTKQQLKNKITELEQWLTDNHSEHIARPQIECDLRKAKEQLAKIKANAKF